MENKKRHANPALKDEVCACPLDQVNIYRRPDNNVGIFTPAICAKFFPIQSVKRIMLTLANITNHYPFDEAETLPFRAGRKPRSSCFKLFLSLNLSTLRECNGIKLSLPGGFFPYPNN